jgi:ubiquinone biosynthesis protein
MPAHAKLLRSRTGVLCSRPKVFVEMSPPTRIGWLHAAGRLQRVSYVLAKHGFGEVVAALGVMVPRLPGGAAPVPSRERLAQRLADTLTELGPTYVKLGQLMATRADLFPAEVTRALSSLHSSVAPIPFATVKKTVEEELGQPLTRAFAHFEERSLAAASIGQVHRARLHDGSDVVVKVQRPGLRIMIEADLAIMRRIAQLLSQSMPEVAAYDPAALVEAFARSIRQELDFRTEAGNANKLRAVLRDASEVHVPNVYPAWTTERVIVMEFVAGMRIGELSAEQKTRTRAALLRAFVRQTVEHGVFHADPHPGNMLVLADGRVVLLDLGTIDVLDGRMRSSLFKMGFALAFGRRHALSQGIVDIAHTPGEGAVDHARLTADIDTVLRATSEGGGIVLGQMFAMSRQHSLRLPPPLLALMRAMAILDGVLRGLDPSKDLVRDVRREVAWAAVRSLKRGVTSSLRRVVSATRGYVDGLVARLPKRVP